MLKNVIHKSLIYYLLFLFLISLIFFNEKEVVAISKVKFEKKQVIIRFCGFLTLFINYSKPYLDPNDDL